MKLNENDLDKILENRFKNSELFSTWFLSKTKFSKLTPRYKWSRSDNPWGRFTVEIVNEDTGKKEVITRDSETDILVVFESEKENIALHIENKLANGKFTQYQPELYSKRAKAWCNNNKYGNYSDFETILVAPVKFYKNNFLASQHFDKFVSYEEIGILIPEFLTSLEDG